MDYLSSSGSREATLEALGLTAEELARSLAYYRAHREEVDGALVEQRLALQRTLAELMGVDRFTAGSTAEWLRGVHEAVDRLAGDGHS